jgi:hypothetical protein
LLTLISLLQILFLLFAQARNPKREDTILKNMMKSSKTAALDSCGYCGESSVAKMKTCSKCRRVKFCSDACNREGWPRHKAQCREWCAEAAKEKGGKHAASVEEQLEIMD